MGNVWHAPYELLKPETQDLARAIQSLMEELEAIDWYGQRADVTHDDQLRAILEHNRDEEKEHAAMLLEWIRRRDPTLDEALKTYLFSSGDITAIEEEVMETPSSESPTVSPSTSTEAEAPTDASKPAFTVGSLRPGRKASD